MGRFGFAHIKDVVGDDFSQASVSFCGPVAMRDQLRKAFVEAGLKPSRFHFEMFELRSGIGFRKCLGWLLSKRATKRSQTA